MIFFENGVQRFSFVRIGVQRFSFVSPKKTQSVGLLCPKLKRWTPT
ncbi:MAG: hypothetical protein KAI83_04135 [Thiomargarita sp.]|nr:hypothetical protein [Thiomargarita sp.]